MRSPLPLYSRQTNVAGGSVAQGSGKESKLASFVPVGTEFGFYEEAVLRFGRKIAQKIAGGLNPGGHVLHSASEFDDLGTDTFEFSVPLKAAAVAEVPVVLHYEGVSGTPIALGLHFYFLTEGAGGVNVFALEVGEVVLPTGDSGCERERVERERTGGLEESRLSSLHPALPCDSYRP